jgi:hypothetical protein
MPPEAFPSEWPLNAEAAGPSNAPEAAGVGAFPICCGDDESSGLAVWLLPPWLDERLADAGVLRRSGLIQGGRVDLSFASSAVALGGRSGISVTFFCQ